MLAHPHSKKGEENMKKLYPVLIVLLLAGMLLPSCTPKAVDCTKPNVFCVGFVTDTAGIADKSFNQVQWEGIQRAGKDLNIHVEYLQSTEASQYGPNLTEFASQGYDMVIAAGFFLAGDLAKVAAQYPNVKFVISDSSFPDSFDVPEGVVGNAECIPNAEGQIYKTDQSAFLAGYTAAGMTKTGKIGYFGGAKIPSVTIFGVGMQAGIEAYNAAHGTSVVLLGWDSNTGEGSFTGDFSDLTKAQQAATSLFDEGADIVAGVGGLIGSTVFPIARERGGYGMWVDVDGYVRWPEYRDVMLTSIMKGLGQAHYDIIKATLDGKFNGCGTYIGDYANKGVEMAPYHDLDSKVPAALKAEVEALKTKIISGELTDTGCVSHPDYCAAGLY
jgi:basic membrane protein A